jgi:hypothetical protein
MAAHADLFDQHVALTTVSEMNAVGFAQLDERPWRQSESAIPTLQAALLMHVDPHSDVVVRNLLATCDFSRNLFHFKSLRSWRGASALILGLL